MKIDPKTLAFDIDGVVADTMSLFLAIADADFGINHIRYDEISEYDMRNPVGIDELVMREIIDRILVGQYMPPLNPIADAPDVLRRINQASRPTLFVTARPDAAHITEWMAETLGFSNGEMEVVATGSFEKKTDILVDKNIQYFVEDRLDTCFLLAEAGIQPIVFKQPWNRRAHPFSEVENWRELESMIAFE